MGLPQTQQPTTAASTSAGAPPKSISDLPPEAIQLATQLFDYAREGRTPELDQYITAGIPVNLTNGKGDTLLMLASYHGHLATVHMLLGKGADPNVKNERGQSIIAGAVFKGEEDIVKALKEDGDADLELGQPNAREAARMFKRVGCLRLFGMEDEAREVENGQP